MTRWQTLLSTALTSALIFPAARLLAQVPASPSFQWANVAYMTQNPNNQLGSLRPATAIDGNGAIYSTLRFNHSEIVLSGMTLPLSREYNGLVKYAPQGQVEWTKFIGEQVYPTSVVIAPDGDVVLAGSFAGTARFDSTTLNSNGFDFFLARFSPDGQLRWVSQGAPDPLGIYAQREVLRVLADRQGNFYLLGRAVPGSPFGTTAAAGPAALPTSNADNAAFCAKFDGAGQLQWVYGSENPGIFATTPYFTQAIGTSDGGTDAAGNVYLTGYMPQTFTWNGTVLGSPTSGHNRFWVKLDPQGNVLSSFTYEALGTGEPLLEVDGAGHSYLAESIRNDVSLNGTLIRVPTVPNGPNGNIANFVFMARLDASGQPQWTQVLSPRQYSQTLLVHDLALGNQDQTLFYGGTFNGDSLGFSTGGAFTPSGVYFQSGLNGALDANTGAAQWTDVITGRGRGVNQEVLGISANAAGELALTGIHLTDTLQCGTVLVGSPGANPFGSKFFTAKVGQARNYISGTYYLDENRNGVRDSADRPAPAGLLVALSPTGPFVSTDLSGHFEGWVGAGTWTISLAQPLPSYTEPANSLVAGFGADFGGSVTGVEIGLVPDLLRPDVRVLVTPGALASPGQPLQYRVTYDNRGTVAAAGLVRLTLDNRLTFGGGSQPLNVTGNVVSTTYANLAPGQQRSFTVWVTNPAALPAGQVLESRADITLNGDQSPADNTDVSRQPVHTGALTSDVRVSHAELTPAQVSAGEWLDYVVWFQNEGTAPAQDVRIRAALPAALLNLRTLEVVPVTHAASWQLIGNQLEIRCAQANLAPQGTGVIRFRLKPVAGLATGTRISVAPVVALDQRPMEALPPAVTVVRQVTGLADAATLAPGTDVWPNPAAADETLFVKLPTASGSLTLRLTDGLGRTVRTQTAPAAETTSFDLRGVAPGLYLLRAEGPETRLSYRVVVR